MLAALWIDGLLFEVQALPGGDQAPIAPGGVFAPTQFRDRFAHRPIGRDTELFRTATIHDQEAAGTVAGVDRAGKRVDDGPRQLMRAEQFSFGLLAGADVADNDPVQRPPLANNHVRGYIDGKIDAVARAMKRLVPQLLLPPHRLPVPGPNLRRSARLNLADRQLQELQAAVTEALTGGVVDFLNPPRLVDQIDHVRGLLDRELHQFQTFAQALLFRHVVEEPDIDGPARIAIDLDPAALAVLALNGNPFRVRQDVEPAGVLLPAFVLFLSPAKRGKPRIGRVHFFAGITRDGLGGGIDRQHVPLNVHGAGRQVLHHFGQAALAMVPGFLILAAFAFEYGHRQGAQREDAQKREQWPEAPIWPQDVEGAQAARASRQRRQGNQSRGRRRADHAVADGDPNSNGKNQIGKRRLRDAVERIGEKDKKVNHSQSGKEHDRVPAQALQRKTPIDLQPG